MSDFTDLERRYRRLLMCYPRAFRREYGEEILSVLMAGAETGQQRPRPGETVDLVGHAVWLRVRPRVPRSQPALLWAVGLMYMCAVIKLAGVPVLPASSPQPIDVGISWGAFALLAWANGRGYDWARVLFVVWFGLHTLALVADVVQGSAFSATAGVVIGSAVLWLLELSASVLIMSKRSRRYYRQMRAQA